MRVTMRLFAAAREAVGSPERVLDLAEGSTIADALGALDPDGSAAPVLDRCSLLVDGVAETERESVLVDGATVDVLPPFAGG